MSSSPVELLEGWRLNHTRGLSLLATVAVSPWEASGVEVLGVEVLGVEVAESSPPPQAVRPRAMAAARASARAFFIRNSPFPY